MSNFHISEDGVARRCSAQSPATCRVTKGENEQHYETASEAQQAYEKHQMENLFNSVEKAILTNQAIPSAPTSLQKTEATKNPTFNTALIPKNIDEEIFEKKQSEFNKIKLNALYSEGEMRELEVALDENSTELNKRIKKSSSKKELLKNLEHRSNNDFNILYNHANLENYYSTPYKVQEYRKKKIQDKRKVMKTWREEHKVVKKALKQANNEYEKNPTRETREAVFSLESRAEILDNTIYDMKRGIFSWD